MTGRVSLVTAFLLLAPSWTAADDVIARVCAADDDACGVAEATARQGLVEASSHPALATLCARHILALGLGYRDLAACLGGPSAYTERAFTSGRDELLLGPTCADPSGRYKELRARQRACTADACAASLEPERRRRGAVLDACMRGEMAARHRLPRETWPAPVLTNCLSVAWSPPGGGYAAFVRCLDGASAAPAN